MINALTWLLLYQLVGEVLARLLSLPVPGPVIGMALLFATLLVRERLGVHPVPTYLQDTASALLQHLSLLFVPAGTGVMLYLQLIADEWLPIGAALILSTFAGLAVTGLVLKALIKRQAADDTEGAHHAA